ncbi:MAG: hypothetical protein ACPL1Y_06275 [Thermoplasmata archaeon]
MNGLPSISKKRSYIDFIRSKTIFYTTVKKRKESVNFLVIAGLTITIWQALGFLAEIIR